MADAVLAFEDQVRGREGGVDIGRTHRVLGEHVVGFERIEDRRERLGSHRDVSARGPESGPIHGRDEGQGLGVMLDLATDRARGSVGPT